MHLRVSATDLDAVRYFHESEDGDLQELLAQLRRESEPTRAMLAGTALHDALEHAEPGEHDTLASGEYRFTIRPDVELALPKIREMKATREYQIGDVTVTLVGKVDAIHGLTVTDHKMTGNYDAERFLSSLQWRVYLEVFGADVFRWIVYEAKERDEKAYEIADVHELSAYRYPDISADVLRALSDFVAFARAHLPEKFTEVAA